MITATTRLRLLWRLRAVTSGDRGSNLREAVTTRTATTEQVAGLAQAMVEMRVTVGALAELAQAMGQLQATFDVQSGELQAARQEAADAQAAMAAVRMGPVDARLQAEPKTGPSLSSNTITRASIGAIAPELLVAEQAA